MAQLDVLCSDKSEAQVKNRVNKNKLIGLSMLSFSFNLIESCDCLDKERSVVFKNLNLSICLIKGTKNKHVKLNGSVVSNKIELISHYWHRDQSDNIDSKLIKLVELVQIEICSLITNNQSIYTSMYCIVDADDHASNLLNVLIKFTPSNEFNIHESYFSKCSKIVSSSELSEEYVHHLKIIIGIIEICNLDTKIDEIVTSESGRIAQLICDVLFDEVFLSDVCVEGIFVLIIINPQPILSLSANGMSINQYLCI